MNFDFDSVYLHDGIASAPTLASDYSFYQSKPRNAYRVPVSSRHESNEGQMHITRGQNGSFNRGELSENLRHVTSGECHDWLADQLRDQSAKVIARKSGQGQRAAESVKQGRNGLTMAHLVSLCRADEDFRLEFFKFCGGQLEGDPEMVAALSKAINAVVQRKQGRE